MLAGNNSFYIILQDGTNADVKAKVLTYSQITYMQVQIWLLFYTLHKHSIKLISWFKISVLVPSIATSQWFLVSISLISAINQPIFETILIYIILPIATYFFLM